MSATTTTLDDLKAAFAARGFKFQPLREDHKPGIFYKRIETKRPCMSNEKDQLVVNVYDFSHLHATAPIAKWHFDVEIVGEVPPGIWADLKFYGLIETNIFKQLSFVEAALIRAWEALTS